MHDSFWCVLISKPAHVCCSFLPGQEAGNVDVVLESGFGEYQKRPSEIASVVGSWLEDPDLLNSLSRAAMKAGNPYAADEIVADIGQQAIAWMNLNEK
jgi:1,2-diacylglycerol 3-beta-galactosyltransferase